MLIHNLSCLKHRSDRFHPAWLADESPLNDLDQAESEDQQEAPDLDEEALENLEELPPPPDPIPEPGPM